MSMAVVCVLVDQCHVLACDAFRRTHLISFSFSPHILMLLLLLLLLLL